jgi:hypothetical protein
VRYAISNGSGALTVEHGVLVKRACYEAAAVSTIPYTGKASTTHAVGLHRSRESSLQLAHAGRSFYLGHGTSMAILQALHDHIYCTV